MIYTITLNPSIDYIATLQDLTLGRVNRLDHTRLLPGGKGINVSRILKALDQPTTALGLVGGFTGEFVKASLQDLGLACAFTPVAGATRINMKLKAQQETELNASGPTISEKEAEAFKTQLAGRLKTGDVVVMAGSLPTGLKANFYQELIPLIRQRGADFVIDTTGQALLDTLSAKPYVVKPNHHELAALFHDAEYPDIASTVAAGRKLLDLGAQHVLVSMAGKGALMIEKDHAYHGTVPKQPAVNSVGAGDSMLAGFTGTLNHTGDALEAFKVGIACGSATAFTEDLANREQIEAVKATITIKEV